MGSYLEQNIDDCSFIVGYLPGKDANPGSSSDGIYIMVLTITEDVSSKIPFVYTQDLTDKSIPKQDSPIILELSIMISVYLKNYSEGLKAISKVIQKLADMSRFVTLDFSFSLSMYNMTMDQSYNLWQALSTTVLPNVVYKLRHVYVQPDIDENAESTPQVVELTINTKKK